MLNRLTDAVVANSDAAASFAIDHQAADPRKVRVIRNGVEPVEPIDEEERAALRARLGAAAGDLLMGCVANYRDVKRHALLIEAFAEVARERPRLRLALVGDGPMRPEIERQLRDLGLTGRVHLHGRALDARHLVAAFDVAVQASRTEGLPNALLEAASAGRPIVATAAGGSGEIVLDGETGLLVPVEDRTRLSRRWRASWTTRSCGCGWGKPHDSTSRSQFGMDRFVREWVALYEGLAVAKGLPRGTRESRWSQPDGQLP